MGTKAWKLLEKKTAEVLGGTRLMRIDYSLSQPDVVAPITLGNTDYTILAECKYSVNQNWHTYITNCFALVKGEALVQCNGLLFWDLAQTKPVLTKLVNDCLTDTILAEMSIISIDKTIPKYINDWLSQANFYVEDVSWLAKHPDIHLEQSKTFPILVLGQAKSRTRIAAIKYEWLMELG